MGGGVGTWRPASARTAVFAVFAAGRVNNAPIWCVGAESMAGGARAVLGAGACRRPAGAGHRVPPRTGRSCLVV